MRFDRIALRNFKCYEDAAVALDPGVTVVHGLNGSGKSSLLEACFFTLYGARALDRTLEDVITRGAEELETELAFTHAGGAYTLRRRVRATGDRPTTAECVLETPADTIEGATDVEAHVADLLRMDDEAFVNCAYVRQGEVNKLIEASPAERQDMIDALLQLGRLEAYRERAGDARLGVEDVLTGKRERLATLEDQIEEKEAKDLYDTLDALRTDLGEVTEEIEHYEAQRETAEETLAEARDVLEGHEERREELAEVTADVESLTEQIAETEREREDLGDELTDVRERISERTAEVEALLAETDAGESTVDERREALEADAEDLAEAIQDAELQVQAYENQSTNLADRADADAERAAEKRAEADSLEAAADETAATLADRRDRLADLEDEIDALESRFDDAPVDPEGAESLAEERRETLEDRREREQRLAAELEAAEERVAEAEALLAEGKCPECGQPVDGAPHVESIEEDRARVADLEDTLQSVREERADAEAAVETAEDLANAAGELETSRERRDHVAELLAERETTVEEKRSQAETLREEAADLDEAAAETREVAAEKRSAAASERERLADLEERREAVTAELERLETVADLRDAVAEDRAELERLRERRESLADLNEERRDRLADLRERREELREVVDEDAVAEAEAEVERAEDYLEEVEDELADLRGRRERLQGQIGGIENEIESLEDLREDRDRVAERVATLDDFHAEIATLESTYGDLRADLRQQNVRRLETLLNESFELVYGNDSYSHIELDGTYELTVYQKDGESLRPDQLSGGERALFNLSLRTAVYRLLAEGIDGAAPMPPLILDEPTVFLDAGHVSRLVDLVDDMRQRGVEQIIVVSHDDELVGAADDVVHVETDPTTNRSRVEKAGSPLP